MTWIIVVVILILLLGSLYWYYNEDKKAVISEAEVVKTPDGRYIWIKPAGAYESGVIYKDGIPFANAASRCDGNSLASLDEVKMGFDRGLNRWIYGWINPTNEFNAVFSRAADPTRKKEASRPALFGQNKFAETKKLGAWCAGSAFPQGVKPEWGMRIR